METSGQGISIYCTVSRGDSGGEDMSSVRFFSTLKIKPLAYYCTVLYCTDCPDRRRPPRDEGVHSDHSSTTMETFAAQPYVLHHTHLSRFYLSSLCGILYIRATPGCPHTRAMMHARTSLRESTTPGDTYMP